jgi:hypothetical protein
MAGSSFAGLLTRVEIGHIRMRCAGKGRISSCVSGDGASNSGRLATAALERRALKARSASDERDRERRTGGIDIARQLERMWNVRL